VIGKAAAGIAAAVIGMLLFCAGAVGIFLTGGADTSTAASTGCDTTLTTAAAADPTINTSSSGSRATLPTVAASLPPVGRWTPTQVANAAIIIATGNRLGIPVRGWVIAVATAMQESTLHNYGNLGPRNDHDSLGLFQQRPSQGWGTPAQILSPTHAATSFYQHLLRVRGWQTLPLTRAAQAVQRSAFPTAYAKWEQPATTLVHVLTGLTTTAVDCDPDTDDTTTSVDIGATGWTAPIHGAITSGFRTRDRPHHDGVDIGTTRGTLIHAAAAGTVTSVACTAHTPTGVDVGCDTDGNRTLSGLGWYVTISHPGGITTTYGHQLIHPLVDVGQPIAAGDILGLLGSSGDSSGPHLYFKVTVAGTPVDPVPFMAAHDASLTG
jgi:murein DD-endopeptidase MepM/ murein hydrolase activator NlpD